MSDEFALEPREVAEGVYWLGGCFPLMGGGGVVHGHINCYLVKGSEASVLVDTGDPQHWDAIERQLDALLEGESLDYICPSHPEIPHAGNLPILVERYPDVKVCGDVRDYHVYYPTIEKNLVSCGPEDCIDLGSGRQLILVPALVYDLHNTLWAYDTGGKVMFVSDGFCYIHGGRLAQSPDDEPSHMPGQCQLVSGELDGGPTVDQAAYGTGKALYWTRFVDISAAFEQIEELFERYPTEMIGPCHGNVISDPERVMPVSIAAHRHVYEG